MISRLLFDRLICEIIHEQKNKKKFKIQANTLLIFQKTIEIFVVFFFLTYITQMYSFENQLILNFKFMFFILLRQTYHFAKKKK